MSGAQQSTRNRFGRRLAAVCAALMIGMSGVITSPASAAPASYVATPNGMVGVQQTMVIYAPRQVNQVATVSGTQGAVGVTLQTVIGGNGYGSLFWTPMTAGTWTFTGAGSIASAAPTTVSVAATPTQTILEIPNTMQINTTMDLLVVVNTQLGNLAPVGVVTVTTGFGSTVGSAYLTPGSGAEASFATIPFTPTSLGVIPMVATFTPTNGNFSASTSAQPAVQVIATPPPLALRLPGSFNVGQTVFITAFVTPQSQQGVASIQVLNQGALSGSVPLTNGTLTVPWTPVNAGNTTITASFTNSTNTASGVASQPIAVGPALPADRITVAPTGQPAWVPGTTITMRRGQNLLLNGSAASGSPVVIDESGPCVINAALLTAVGTGTCTITAVSAGGSAFTAGSATYSVAVVAPKRQPRR